MEINIPSVQQVALLSTQTAMPPPQHTIQASCVPRLIAAIQAPSIMKGPMCGLIDLSQEIDIVALMMTTRLLYYHDYATIVFSKRVFEFRALYDYKPVPRLTNLSITNDFDLIEFILRNTAQKKLDHTQMEITSSPQNEIDHAKLLSCQSRLQFVTYLDLSKTPTLDTFIVLLPWAFPLLRGLCLSHKQELVDTWLLSISFYCPRLESLIIPGCHRITDEGLRYLSERCHHLTYLDLSDYIYCERLTDEGIQFIARGCPQLTFIDLSHTAFTDIALIALSRGCPALRSISTSASHKFTNHGLLSLYNECLHLKCLDADSCLLEEDSLQTVLSRCTRLESLDFGQCSFSYIKNSTNSLPLSIDHCFLLHTLSVCYSDRVTDDTVHGIASTCPLLTKLNLTHCRRITHASAQCILRSCRNLSTLILQSCVEMTFTPLSFSSSPHPELTSLNASLCPLIGDTCFETILAQCPRLVNLDLRGCDLTQKTIDIAFSLVGSWKIAMLDLRGCPRLDTGRVVISTETAMISQENIPKVSRFFQLFIQQIKMNSSLVIEFGKPP